MNTADLFEPQSPDTGRSAPELTALLLELGRLVKARRFYGPGDPRLVAIFERTLRAWQADLARHGPLDLEAGPSAFRSRPLGDDLSATQLGDLLGDFTRHQVQRARFDQGIDAEAFAAFVELLAASPRRREGETEMLSAFYAWVPSGISLNDTPPGEAPRPVDESALHYPERSERGTGAGSAVGEDSASALNELLKELQASEQLEVVAPALLVALERESDPERRDRIQEKVIALGDKALPQLLRAMEGENSVSVGRAVRLAAEVGSPAAVPRLAALLEGDDKAIREQAARALARIGDASAIETLGHALTSSVPGVSELAIRGLTSTRSSRAIPLLLGVLKQATDSGRTDLGRNAIRALGQLGRPEITPHLAELLLRKGLRNRRRLRELKLAAAAALAAMPGDEAVAALAQAASGRDGRVRRAAQTALQRRAHSLRSAQE